MNRRGRKKKVFEGDVVSMYVDQRLSTHDIARKEKTAPSVVVSFLKRKGVEMRNQSDAMRMYRERRHANETT
jgi:hypothetical protein